MRNLTPGEPEEGRFSAGRRAKGREGALSKLRANDALRKSIIERGFMSRNGELQ